MFRAMRRKNQELSLQESEQLLAKGSSGVLALLGDEGYPYAVPLSYIYEKGKLYFHGAKTGHKIDAIQGCDRASFCVISQDQVISEEYTTYYKSVIVFGKIRLLTEREEMLHAIEILADKYNPKGTVAERDTAIAKEWDGLCMMELTAEHITGKQARELMKRGCE